MFWGTAVADGAKDEMTHLAGWGPTLPHSGPSYSILQPKCSITKELQHHTHTSKNERVSCPARCGGRGRTNEEESHEKVQKVDANEPHGAKDRALGDVCLQSGHSVDAATLTRARADSLLERKLSAGKQASHASCSANTKLLKKQVES